MNKFTHRLATAVKPILRQVLKLWFRPEYLQGRHFEGLVGYKWAVRAVWTRNVLRLAPPVPWPAALTCKISRPANIRFHPDDLNNFQSPGTYFQNYGAQITLGRGVYIAPNVGIITQNHEMENLDEHSAGEDVTIGERCWIGMNSVILPGVTLGPDTVVAAGAVVTKSFSGGSVVLGGVPARILKWKSTAASVSEPGTSEGSGRC